MSDQESSSEADLESGQTSDDSETNYIVSGEYLPYQNEPLASETDSDGSEDEDEADIDGLTIEVLRQRFEKEIPVEKW
jgi:hypothetical protein